MQRQVLSCRAIILFPDRTSRRGEDQRHGGKQRHQCQNIPRGDFAPTEDLHGADGEPKSASNETVHHTSGRHVQAHRPRAAVDFDAILPDTDPIFGDESQCQRIDTVFDGEYTRCKFFGIVAW